MTIIDVFDVYLPIIVMEAVCTEEGAISADRVYAVGGAGNWLPVAEGQEGRTKTAQ